MEDSWKKSIRSYDDEFFSWMNLLDLMNSKWISLVFEKYLWKDKIIWISVGELFFGLWLFNFKKFVSSSFFANFPLQNDLFGNSWNFLACRDTLVGLYWYRSIVITQSGGFVLLRRRIMTECQKLSYLSLSTIQKSLFDISILHTGKNKINVHASCQY